MLNLLKSDIDKREVDKEGVDEKMKSSFNDTVETE